MAVNQADDDFDDPPLRPGQLTTTGWAIGVISLAAIAMVGVVIGFAVGSQRPTVVSTQPTSRMTAPEVAQNSNTTPSTKLTPQEPTTPQPIKPTEPSKKIDPPKKVEPPKKDEPKKTEPKPEPPKPEVKLVTFMKDIFPIFQDKCLECHQPGLVKGGLDLKTLLAIEKGGNSGKALVAGKPGESLIWKTIEDGEMPPAGKKPLTTAEKMLIKAWIESGGK